MRELGSLGLDPLSRVGLSSPGLGSNVVDNWSLDSIVVSYAESPFLKIRRQFVKKYITEGMDET